MTAGRRRSGTVTAALRRRLRAVHDTQPGEEGAALLTVVLLMFIVGALSVLVLGAVVAQVRPTTATQESTRTVFAAEAGVQTALTQIRTATASAGSQTGNRRLLPCSVSGTAEGTGGTVPYTVTVKYYLKDPSGAGASDPQNLPLSCTPGGGPVRVPNYALILSAASDTAGGVLTQGRTLQATYTFNVIDQNVPGGMIMTARGGLCLQANGALAGRGITYVDEAQCTGALSQMWVYDTDYHIVLASTVGTGSQLCVTQPALSAVNRTVTLESCQLGSRDPMQLWGFGDLAQFNGQNADNTNYGSNCLWAGTTGSPLNQPLKAGGGSDTCRGGNTDWGAFAPEPRVGAGPAGLATSQIVNYQQFGRCTDVTGFRINATYHIVYPCKQDPSPGMTHLAWNHKWFYGAEVGTRSEPVGAAPMSTRIRVFVDNRDEYCFTAPAPGASPAYLVFRTCDGSASQQFTRTYATGNPETSFQFRTSDGRCMSAGPTVDVGLVVSTIVAAPCTSGAEQKWNAPPSIQEALVSSQGEVGVR